MLGCFLIIEEGKADKENNVLKNAPHTVELATSDEWQYPYPRAKAVYPLPYVKENKFWSRVGRVDNVYWDLVVRLPAGGGV